MNAAGIRVLNNALNQALDQLYRAKHQKEKIRPGVENGPYTFDNIQKVIKIYQKEVDELSEALAEAKGNGNNKTESRVAGTGNKAI